MHINSKALNTFSFFILLTTPFSIIFCILIGRILSKTKLRISEWSLNLDLGFYYCNKLLKSKTEYIVVYHTINRIIFIALMSL